jgi:trimethylamine:corrinoid methyltransferase-like protein
VQPLEDLPVNALIDQLLADQHLIMAEHTTRHWPDELYLPGSVVDRDNREAWVRKGSKDAYQRAIDEVNRRLAAYHQLETDPRIDDELRRIIRSGLESQQELPEVPVAPEPVVARGPGTGERRHNRRREAAMRRDDQGQPRT